MSVPLYSRLPTSSRPLSPGNPDFEYDATQQAPRWCRRWFWPLSSCFHVRAQLRLFKVVLVAAVLVLAGVFIIWEPQVILTFYLRSWVRQEIEPVAPLAGCFAPERISPLYNASTQRYAGSNVDVHSGYSMRLGMDCYNFAGTIASTSKVGIPLSRSERTVYHTYWRVDLVSFGARQEWMLKSYFATQDVDATRLILWSNGDLRGNPVVDHWIARYPDAFETRIANVDELVRGTEMEGSEVRNVQDKRAWIDGDLIRLLVLWEYGGVWVDMDSLLTRDLAPLLASEFVTQWDCWGEDKPYIALNGALMHFHQHSPYLCEAFHIMASEHPPRPGSTDWGALLYLKLWRRLVAEAVAPFKILPFCFSDGRSCRWDNRLPDPFEPDPSDESWTLGLGREAGGGLDHVLSQVFALHLHNQWDKEYPRGGWVERLLLKRYDERLGGK